MNPTASAIDPALFPKRAAKMLGNAALHQLVQDMAGSMATQAHDINEIQSDVSEIKDMCLKILGRLT